MQNPYDTIILLSPSSDYSLIRRICESQQGTYNGRKIGKAVDIDQRVMTGTYPQTYFLFLGRKSERDILLSNQDHIGQLAYSNVDVQVQA